MKNQTHRVYLVLGILGISLAVVFQNCGYPITVLPGEASIAFNSLSVPQEGDDVVVRVKIPDRRNGIPKQLHYKISPSQFGRSNDFVAHEGIVEVDGSTSLEQMANVGIDLKIPTVDDNLFEGADESFDLMIYDPDKIYLPEPIEVKVFLVENDEAPVITIADVVAVSEGPNGSPEEIKFDVNLSRPSAFPIELKFSQYTGTAEFGQDYSSSLANHSLVIEAEQTIASFVFSTQQDSIFEQEETGQFQVSTESLASIMTNNLNNMVRFTILNSDDPPLINIAGPVIVSEGNDLVFSGTIAPISIDRDVIIPYEVDLNSNLNWRGEAPFDGQQLKPSDFVNPGLLVGSVNLRKGDSTFTIRIPIANDNIMELAEHMTLNFPEAQRAALVGDVIESPIDPGYDPVLHKYPYFWVTNNSEFKAQIAVDPADKAKLSVAPIPPIEEGESGTFRVVSNRPIAVPIQFVVSSEDSSRAGATLATMGVDYPFINNEIHRLNPTDETSNSEKTITINTFEDSVYEGGAGTYEEFFVRILDRRLVNPSTLSLVSPISSVISAGYTAPEINTVAYTETATEFADVRIEDNEDAPKLVMYKGASTFSSSIDSVSEGSGSYNFSIRLVNGSDGMPMTSSKDVSFRYRVRESATVSAKAGLDFTADDQIAIIPAGASSVNISLAIANDTLFELPETFRVNFSNFSGGPPSISGVGSELTLTILDNDPVPEVSISALGGEDSDSGYERMKFLEPESGSKNVNLQASISTPSGEPISVKVSTLLLSGDNITLTGSKRDIDEVLNSTLTIPAGSILSNNISLKIYGDNYFEQNQKFTLRAVNQNLSVAKLKNSGSDTKDFEVTIIDDSNDELDPRLTLSAATIIEGNSPAIPKKVSVTVNLGNPAEFSLDFYLSTINGPTAAGVGEAQSGTDYTGLTNAKWSLSAGATTFSFSIDILGDTIFEAPTNEQFRIKLNKIEGNASTFSSFDQNNVVKIINIQDDDAKPIVSLVALSGKDLDTSYANMKFAEPLTGRETVNLQAQIPSAAGSNITLRVSTKIKTDDTAIQSGLPRDIDRETNRVLTIPRGSTTSNTMAIDIHADDYFEGDQTFTIEIENNSTGQASLNGTSGNSYEFKATIKDSPDDVINPSISFPAGTVMEGDRVYPVLSFNRRAEMPLVYRVKTVNGSAVAGSDYTGLSSDKGPFAEWIVPANKDSFVLNNSEGPNPNGINTLNDEDIESNERFKVEVIGIYEADGTTSVKSLSGVEVDIEIVSDDAASEGSSSGDSSSD